MDELNRLSDPGQSQHFLTGLLGRDIQLSRSPQMHEDEAHAQGLDLVYRLFDFSVLGMNEQDLPVFLETLQASGFSGINVTHPYKQAVIPLLDELSEGAARVGAVNTIAFRDGKRLGSNTDVTGFAESFRRGLPEAAMDVVFQAGAGGAGAATAHAMLAMGANKIVLYDPQEARAEHLCDALRQSFGIERAQVARDIASDITRADGIINATPIGMAGHPGVPFPTELLRPCQWVADIVYFPLQTELLRHAEAIGCAILDGGGMAVFQAAGAFEIFTGRPADGHRMRKQFLARSDGALE